MQRREFVRASLASSALAFTKTGEAEAPPGATREFYQIRQYRMRTGPQTKLTESYFTGALIPALTRMGLGPIGAFRLEFGPETPTFYLLIPGPSIAAVAMMDLRLAQDAAFLSAAEPFWNAPAVAPAFLRAECSLLAAFEGWPKLAPSVTPGGQGKRIFQLRTYESPSDRDHVRKVEMFHSGEFEIFKNAGFHPIFFGDTLIGPRMPCLTYMLSFANMGDLNTQWAAFIADPAWKKLSTSPKYSYEDIVSNISNLILSPLEASQIR